MKPLLFILLFLVLSGCLGSELNEGEDYGNLLDSPEGLVVTEGEHTGGWGRADCTTCHNLENIHLVDRSGGAVDIQAVYEQAIAGENAGCPACHGTNGVP